MRTLVFCTSYAAQPYVWDKRIRRWKNWIDSTNLVYDNMLVADDASPCLPNDLQIVENVDLPSKTVLHHFKDHLGKSALNYYPGWYRSFILPVKYIEKFGFEKIIHIESDSFLISDRIIEWVNNLNKGWTGLWCPKYNFPETCVQIICESSFNDYFRMSKLSFDEVRSSTPRYFNSRRSVNLRRIINKRFRERKGPPPKKSVTTIAELFTPFTDVCKDFLGDRWGENGGGVPRDADYACQMSHDIPEEMFWWINTI